MCGREESPAVWSEATEKLGAVAAPDSPVALYVSSEGPDPRTVPPDCLFVSADDVARRMVAAVNVQAVTITLQLRLFLAKALLVRTQVGARTRLGRRKSCESERYCQNQAKGFAHGR